MIRIIWCAAFLLGLFMAAPSANAWDRGDADVLTVLPNTASGQPSSVEGLTVGPDGNIYVPTFGFNATGALSGNATLYVLKPDGKVVRQVTIANSSPHVLGLRFNPVNGFLLVLDFGAGQVLQPDDGRVVGLYDSDDWGLRPQCVDLRQTRQCLHFRFV